MEPPQVFVTPLFSVLLLVTRPDQACAAAGADPTDAAAVRGPARLNVSRQEETICRWVLGGDGFQDCLFFSSAGMPACVDVSAQHQHERG
jgi:hypothetical protein